MRSLGALAVIGVLAAISPPCAGQGADVPDLAPLNPAFLRYLQEPDMVVCAQADERLASGLVPEPIKPVFGRADRRITAMALTSLPTSYDLRALGRLTAVRDQGACGSCWSFASIASLESSLVPGQTWDFSENNVKNTHGFDVSCCSGGNRTMSTAYMARWAGPVAEVDDAYNTSTCGSPTGLTPMKHVQNVIFVPDRAGALDNDAIKQAVMTYGAVYTTYYHTSSAYRSSTKGYYFSGTSSPNHAVCIVGWDDSFPASSFPTSPPGNGAFICRNSWGTWWGAAGYFYISYHDSTLGRDGNAVFTAESADNYDAIYQYDTLGWISSLGYSSSTAWFANVFTASGAGSVEAASFYTPSPNTSYQVFVYLGPTSGPVTGGTLAATKSGTLAEPGYRTVVLDSGVNVAAGQRFSVVARLTCPSCYYPVPIEMRISGYSSSATATAGQSYISSSGTSWTDLTSYYTGANVCLKAFVKSGAPTPGALSVTPSSAMSSSGTVGGPFSPSSQTYTLSNPGGSSINWTASTTQSWVSLSSTSGSLAAGASATVTVSVNSGANSLTAGSYSDTVSFTNATNGQGTTVRSIQLTVNQMPPGQLSVTPSSGMSSSGTVGGPFGPSSQTYTLSNTGGSSINWTASKTQSWVGLSSASGSLSAGASATVTVSINPNANSLSAGSYSDTVSFRNTTNDTGNTTRGVSLSVNAPPGDYQVTRTAFDWIDPTGHAKLTLSNDSCTSAISIPFSFEFYGVSYDRIYVSSNGTVGFASTGMTSYYNVDIPRSYAPNAAIYGYWDDLDPARAGSMCIGMVGTAPNRKVVVSWVGVPHRSQSSALFSFQVILSETTNQVILQYLNLAPQSSLYGRGRSATVGIENQNGGKACKWSYNATSLNNGDALLFARGEGSPSRTDRDRQR